RRVRRHRRRHDRGVRAEHPRHHPAPAGADAARSRARVRADGGQHLPGRADARAAFLRASGAGLGAVRDAHPEAVDVRLGHASRRRHHGGAGAQRGAQDSGAAIVTDVVVIGGGVNGLVTATPLARAGLKTTVVEQSDRVGGCARTSEIAPRFKCPTLAHSAAIDPALVRTLGLERHGLRIVRPAADACAPTKDGRALVLWRDVAKASEEVRAFSAKDAARYPGFLRSVSNISGVLRAVLESAPPSIDDPSAGDVLELLQTGRRFRALGKADAYRLLRWMPMAVADLAGEWFESEALRATVAAGGILGSFLGPWSAGSAALLLLLAAREGQPIASGWFAVGGPGAIADALRAVARDAGVEIKTGAVAARIDAVDGAVSGVTLSTGDEIGARLVVSSVDPKRTLLGLLDPMHLAPEVVRRGQNIRAHGTLAKINFAVSALPRFAGVSRLDASDQTAALSGRIRLAVNIDGIERAFDAAKYGGFADEPWIELAIPSIADAS